MAMPETASTAIIIAGGLHAARVHGDAVPRSRAGADNRSWIGSTLAKPYDERLRSWA